jgi:hypothetical protein
MVNQVAQAAAAHIIMVAAVLEMLVVFHHPKATVAVQMVEILVALVVAVLVA